MANAESSNNKIIVVQGAQYGSEAKGAVAAALCEQRLVDYAIRTGTVNAGHTVLYKGKPYKMQQLPTGWINPGTHLVIGPGAYIHPEILSREIRMIKEATGWNGINQFIHIDHRCGLHLPEHTDRSTASGRHYSMGATGKGCSEAVIDKIRNRGKGGTSAPALFTDWLKRRDIGNPETEPLWLAELAGLDVCDTSYLLNEAWDEGATLLVEGTQGTLLDLHLGPYPYTTHKQTQVGNWLAEAGLSANLPLEVALVARTYPIRVAGNSGPLPRETSWVQVVEHINQMLDHAGLPPRVQKDSLRAFEECCETMAQFWGPATLDWHIETWTQAQREQDPQFVSELHKKALGVLPQAVVDDLCRVFEMTTVTNKLRRVANLDIEALQYSVMLNRPSYLVLTFMNYQEPTAWDKEWDTMPADTRSEIEESTRALGDDLGVPVRYVSTGAATEHVLEVEK